MKITGTVSKISLLCPRCGYHIQCPQSCRVIDDNLIMICPQCGQHAELDLIARAGGEDEPLKWRLTEPS